MAESSPIGRRAFVLGSLAGGVAGAAAGRASAADPGPPYAELRLWRERMIRLGTKYGDALADSRGPIDPLLGATYYDAQRVFYQIGDYTGDRRWSTYAERAMAVYRDRYVLPNKGAIPGYWIFPHGLAMHYRRTQDPKSREAVVRLSLHAAFAADSTPEGYTRDVATSRETAYCLMCLLEAESLGERTRSRRDLLADQALGHVDQWFISRTAPYIQPFMVGLTAEGLIAYHAATGDRRVPRAIRAATDGLWKLWSPARGSFPYVDRKARGVGGPAPAPDLNLLIAPAFAWLFRQTGMPLYRERADVIFASGVRHADLPAAKQFNQNYRWSFDYLAWRRATPAARERQDPIPAQRGTAGP